MSEDLRPEVQKTMAEAATSLISARSKMHALHKELSGFSISPTPEYSSAGLSVLYAAIIQARAYSERTAAIHSAANVLSRLAVATLAYCKAVYGRYYDFLSTSLPKDDRMSWEERASNVRVKMLDLTVVLAKIEFACSEVQGAAESIEILARSIYRARGDLQVAVQVLHAGEVLRETGAD